MEKNEYIKMIKSKLLNESLIDEYEDYKDYSQESHKERILSALNNFIDDCNYEIEMLEQSTSEVGKLEWLGLVEKLEAIKRDYETKLEESRCTGPTKKASSTRKGNKWMQCVSDGKGGHKRVHWGQKGVKVTGKSGNTKRKKSFRARHNCKNAKKGTPQYQACKDW